MKSFIISFGKKRRWSIFLPIQLLLFLVTFHVNAQAPYEEMISSGVKNFKTIVQATDAYYKNNPRAGGYKQYQRWKNFNESRLDAKGNLINVSQWYLNELYKLNMRNAANSSNALAFTGNWIPHGPYQNSNPKYLSGIGNGRVNRLVVDPSMPSVIYAGTPAGGLWRSTNDGINWECLTDGIPTLGISGIAIDYSSPTSNRTIYILTGDGDGSTNRTIGVLKSTDNGTSWQSTGLGPYVNFYVGHDLIMHPTNPQILFAGTNDGIYKTIDGGVNWTKVYNVKCRDLEFKPGAPQIMYACGQNTFMRSTDSGNNWTAITAGLPSLDTTNKSRNMIAISPSNPNYVYLINGKIPGKGIYGGVYRSTNSGVSFSLRSNMPNILSGAADGSGDDSQSGYDLAILVNPTNSEELFVGGINVWRSTNGGTNWTINSGYHGTESTYQHYTHPDIHDLKYINNRIYCASDGGVSISFDNAVTWVNRFTGMNISQIERISVDMFDDRRVLIGMQDNGSSLGDQGFMKNIGGGDGEQCIIDPVNPHIIYFSSQEGDIARYNTNIESSVGIKPGSLAINKIKGEWLTSFELSPANSNIIYAGYKDVWKSYDRGDNWVNITDYAIDTSRGFTGLMIAPSNASVIYVTKGGDMFKTTNDGQSWQALVGSPGYKLPGNKILRIEVHPANSNIVWVCVDGYDYDRKVYRSTDGGVNWSNLASSTLPNVVVNCIVYRNQGSLSGLYAGTDMGVYFLPDSDPTQWQAFNTGFPITIVKDLEIRRNRMIAGTFGRGIWSTELDPCEQNDVVYSGNQNGTIVSETSASITSSASIQSGSVVNYKAATRVKLTPGFRVNGSSSYFKAKTGLCGGFLRMSSNGLEGYYTGPMPGVTDLDVFEDPIATQKNEAMVSVFPNPAETLVNVQYSIPEEAEVVIEIQDITGVVLKTLSKDYFRKGTYRISFDASSFAQGTYVCTMRYHDENISTVFVVIK